MRCFTPQIAWHNKDPILSIDFDPTTTSDQSSFLRFASGGTDTHLLVWHLRNADSLNADLSCVADLTRHNKSVNVVRFSPNGNMMASADDDAYVVVWKCEGKTPTSESWGTQKVLRKHLEDISDLSWSKDSNFVVTGSVDNSAVLFDVTKGSALQVWSEHGGFVQGVSFDPLGQLVATICTDRTLRLFNPKTGKPVSRTLKYPKDWLSTDQAENDNVEGEVNEKQGKQSALLPGQANRIFHDDTLRTFCRRLEFSPKGELLMVPGAILPPTHEKIIESPGQKKSKGVINATVVFCRNSFSNPCSVIPCGSFSVACRFCPMYFQSRRECISYGSDLVNSTKKSERLTSCVGKLKPPKNEKSVLMDTPYRIVYAIATSNSVIIGDTESAEPLAVIGNIHCTRLTDLSWSSDGRVLLVSSSDGFCTLVTFEENELGVPYPMDTIQDDSTANCFPVQPKVVKKIQEKPPTTPKVNKAKGNLLKFFNRS